MFLVGDVRVFRCAKAGQSANQNAVGAQHVTLLVVQPLGLCRLVAGRGTAGRPRKLQQLLIGMPAVLSVRVCVVFCQGPSWVGNLP